MTTLRQIAYGIALLGALSVLLWGNHQRGQAEKARAERDAERIAQLTQRNARQAAVITRIDAELAALRLAQQDLQHTIAGLRLAHATDHIKKKEMQREDPDFQGWAAQPLPDAARRLHQRPALSGADAYRAWLSRRHALQPPAGGAAE